METLVLVKRLFALDQKFLKESLSADALDRLAKLVSGDYRRGRLPLGPREWGMFCRGECSWNTSFGGHGHQPKHDKPSDGSSALVVAHGPVCWEEAVAGALIASSVITPLKK